MLAFSFYEKCFHYFYALLQESTDPMRRKIMQTKAEESVNSMKEVVGELLKKVNEQGKIIEEQSKKMAEQQKFIEQQNNKLEAQFIIFAEQSVKIDEQNKKIDSQNKYIFDLNITLDEKNRDILLKQSESMHQQKTISELKTENIELKNYNRKHVPHPKVEKFVLTHSKTKSPDPNPGKGFLDTFAYPFACRKTKRLVEELKSAAYDGDVKHMKHLLTEHPYLDIDSRGMPDSICSIVRKTAEKTALMLASKNGHLECVKFLCTQDADLNLLDREGLSALDHAQKNFHKDVVDYLRQKGAVNGVDIFQEADLDQETAKVVNGELKFKVS